MKSRIKVSIGNGYFNLPCGVCGCRTETGGVEVQLVVENQQRLFLCPACGKDARENLSKLRDTLRESVKFFRERAREFEEIAEGEIELATDEEYSEAEAEFQRREDEVMFDYMKDSLWRKPEEGAEVIDNAPF
jgi:hypothetical protein